MPQIPGHLTEPADRAEFLVEHYWDKFDFSDTVYCHIPEITEQAFVNFLDVLNYVSVERTHFAVKSMLKKAEVNSTMYAYFIKLYDDYLYNWDSPMQNDEHYIPMLESLLASDKVSEKEKARPAKRLAFVKKNRVDSVANDFSYTDRTGEKGRLSSIKAPNTLLFFHNPGCEMCAEAMASLRESACIQSLVKDRQLVVLAIYPDEEVEAWRAHITDFPSEWLNGYDQGQIIEKEELYDLKAMPTIYLLDQDKRVVLKNVTAEWIEEYFKSLEEDCD